MKESTKLALFAQFATIAVALYKNDHMAAAFAGLAAFTTYYATREDNARFMAVAAVDDARTFSQAISDQLARIEGGLL